MKKELRIIAPLHNNSGYAKASRAILSSALLAGYNVQAIESEVIKAEGSFVREEGTPARRERYLPAYRHFARPKIQQCEIDEAIENRVSSDAPTLIINPPDGLVTFSEYSSGMRIGLTMLEASTIPGTWARSASNCDALIAPSTWNQEVLRNSLPDIPVHLMPLPVDERIYTDIGDIAKLKKKYSFVFVSVFHPSPRKHWRETLHAFTEEFRGEDVLYILKPGKQESVYELAESCVQSGANIFIIPDILQENQLAALYRACDCYVGFGAEGFGVPFVEAGFCGIPSVGLDAGGAKGILTERTGFTAKSVEEPAVGQLPQIYRSTSSRPTATVASMREALRRARNGAEGLKCIVRADMMTQYSRPVIAERLDEILYETRPMFQYTEVIKGLIKPAQVVVVITTHNHLDHTKHAVCSVQDSMPGAKVILVDDDSTDDTREWARECGFSLLECDGGNVSANRQVAVDYIDSLYTDDFPRPYILFMDNDIELPAGFLDSMSSVLTRYPNIGILAPRKVYKKDGGLQNVGNFFNYCAFPVNCGLSRYVVYCDYVESACMLVRPDVWFNIKWNPDYRIFYEDSDYCYQARQTGVDVAATSMVTVTHDAHTTSNKRREESEQNRMRFLSRWKDEL